MNRFLYFAQAFTQEKPLIVEVVDQWYSLPNIISLLTLVAACVALWYTLTQINQQSVSIKQNQEEIKAQMDDLKIQSIASLMTACYIDREDQYSEYKKINDEKDELLEIIAQIQTGNFSYFTSKSKYRAKFLLQYNNYTDGHLDAIGKTQTLIEDMQDFANSLSDIYSDLCNKSHAHWSEYQNMITQIEEYKKSLNELLSSAKKRAGV